MQSGWPERDRELERLNQFIDENDLSVFPEVVVAPDFDEGVRVMLQTHSIGPIKPNLVMMGWPREPDRIVPFVRHLRTSAPWAAAPSWWWTAGCPRPASPGRIDIWWRGKANGSLMLILAYLLTRNWEWGNSPIRILRAVDDDAGLEPARRALARLIDVARVEAESDVVLLDGRSPRSSTSTPAAPAWSSSASNRSTSPKRRPSTPATR